MPLLVDLVGRTFGRLKVLHRVPNKGPGARWCCLCSCGEHKDVSSNALRSGDTQSCGCFLRETATEKAKRLFTKHGGSQLPEYRIWKLMHARCKNSKLSDFQNYGGRGIAVCERWASFELFLKDMGPRPSKKYSIERLNNELGYAPSNCIWATKYVQASNRRNNIFFTFNGETLIQAEWCRRLGISPATFQYRLKNWPRERAFTTEKIPKSLCPLGGRPKAA